MGEFCCCRPVFFDKKGGGPVVFSLKKMQLLLKYFSLGLIKVEYGSTEEEER